MSTSFVDESGTTRIRGKLQPPPGGAQTLAQVLATGNDGDHGGIVKPGPIDCDGDDVTNIGSGSTFGGLTGTAGANIITTGGHIDLGGGGIVNPGTIGALGGTLDLNTHAITNVTSITGLGSDFDVAGGQFKGGGLDTDGDDVQLDGGDVISANNVEIDGDLNHDGAGVGLYGAAPTGRSAAIPDAAAGVVVDAEARAAINTLLAYLRLRGDVTP